MKQIDPQRVVLDISWSALLKILALLAGLGLAFILRDILLLLFVVFIFVAAVNPTIKALQKHMSRGLAVTLFFTLLLSVIVILSYMFVPLLVRQVNNLLSDFPALLETLRPVVESMRSSQANDVLNDAVKNVSSAIQSVSGNVFGAVQNFFGGLFSVITGIVLCFYLLLEEKNAREFFHQILPTDRYWAVYSTIRKISIQLGAWIRGQLTVMLAVAVFNIIAYALLGLPSPLALGVWSGLAEAIPYIGPFLGVLPGVVVAVATGDMLKVVLVVAINFFLIQQLQNFYITPKVMGRAIGLSPVLVILSILVGIALFGVTGAIIALPCAAIISVVVSDWSNLRQLWQEPAQDQEVDEGKEQAA